MKPLFFISGGLISWMFTVVIRLVKQNYKYKLEKSRIEDEIKRSPKLEQEYGDVDAYLQDQSGYQKFNPLSEWILHGLRPLLVLGFITLFYQTSSIYIFTFIGIFVFFLFHEFFYAEKWKDDYRYLLAIIFVWLIFTINISYDAYSSKLKEGKNNEKLLTSSKTKPNEKGLENNTVGIEIESKINKDSSKINVQIEKEKSSAEKFYRVKRETRIKEEPQQESKPLHKIKQGDQIIVLEKTNEFWWKVRYNGIGFIKVSTLELENIDK